MNVETVYTRDRSSGRIHIRTKVNGELQAFEADNLDDAGAFDEIPEAEALAADADQCERCFPRPDSDQVAE